MKLEMFEFLLRVSGHDYHSLDFNPLNPYTHHGAPEPLSRMHRPFAPGYSMHPELSRSPIAGVKAWYYWNQPAILGAVSLAVPAYFIVAATHDFPAVAGHQYQSAVSGQISIGGGGHDLIYGNHQRGSLSSAWNYFAQNF
jgi:hypothetical protein